MLDRSLLLARNGYLFTAALIAAERRALQEDGALTTRLLGRSTLVVSGDAGVSFFYDESKLERHRAVPPPIGLSLFGPGAVHTLDDAAHRHRKALFRHALSQEALDRLLAIAERRWEHELDRWASSGGGEVYATAIDVFGASIIEWAGITEPEDRMREHARRLAEIVDGFGVVGPAYLRAIRARRRSDRWAQGLIQRARAGGAPTGSWLEAVADFTDADGGPLDERTAAVELVNVLRPTVAVAWLASFAAIALVENPQWRARVRDDTAAAEAFAHEVRRYYPFVPLLAACARRDLEFAGHRLRRGHRVLLDVWGTDHGADWSDPWSFDPSRFLGVDPRQVSSFVPQGGGDPAQGHRCPGEGVSNGLLALTVRLLARYDDLDLPPQDRHFSLRRMPTRPASGTRVLLGAAPESGATAVDG
jgi:fatty-acid peroxygenase